MSDAGEKFEINQRESQRAESAKPSVNDPFRWPGPFSRDKKL